MREKGLRLQVVRVQKRLPATDEILKGSLIKRYLACGNPTCKCHKGKEKLHGPYWYLSVLEGKSPKLYYIAHGWVRKARHWIRNRKRLIKGLQELYKLNRQLLVAERKRLRDS